MQEENIFYTVDMQREVRDFVLNLEKEDENVQIRARISLMKVII